jgi:hypothetical protein
MNFQCIALQNAWNPLPGLLSAVGIQLDAVAQHVSAARDRLEGHAIANTRVNCGRRFWKREKPANPLGFGQWQREKAKPTFADKAQTGSPFSWRVRTGTAGRSSSERPTRQDLWRLLNASD